MSTTHGIGTPGITIPGIVLIITSDGIQQGGDQGIGVTIGTLITTAIITAIIHIIIGVGIIRMDLVYPHHAITTMAAPALQTAVIAQAPQAATVAEQTDITLPAVPTNVHQTEPHA
jgi:hypothetical protein